MKISDAKNRITELKTLGNSSQKNLVRKHDKQSVALTYLFIKVNKYCSSHIYLFLWYNIC